MAAPVDVAKTRTRGHFGRELIFGFTSIFTWIHRGKAIAALARQVQKSRPGCNISWPVLGGID
jgi:hypothetical protein